MHFHQIGKISFDLKKHSHDATKQEFFTESPSFSSFLHLLLSREHFKTCISMSFCLSLLLSRPPISSISTFYSTQEGDNVLSWTQWDSGSTFCQQNLKRSRLTVCHLIPGEPIRATPPHSVEVLIHASAGATVPVQLCPNPFTCLCECFTFKSF